MCEGHEDRTKWLRVAACLLLQMSVRVLLRASNRKPSYLREDWIVPSTDEFELRCKNIMGRLPQGSFAEEIVYDMLHECRGHAGHVVSNLLDTLHGEKKGASSK